MPSLLDDDEFKTFLEGLDYPIATVEVMSEYDPTEHSGFPLVVFSELTNTPTNIESTMTGIGEGPVNVAYQIQVLARDCKAKDGTLYDRERACREVTKTIRQAMLKQYGMPIDDQSPCYPMDATANMLTTRYSGVIDNYGYSYSR